MDKEFQEFCQGKHIDSNYWYQLHLIATGASRANRQERIMDTLKNMFTTVETTGRP